jgi:hypothetical protein
VAFALGFSGGFADLVEEPAPTGGSGGGPATWRWADSRPWAPPAPAPPPQPVTIRVVLHAPPVHCAATVIAVRFPATAAAHGDWSCTAQAHLDPMAQYLSDLERRLRLTIAAVKETHEIAEIALVRAAMK